MSPQPVRTTILMLFAAAAVAQAREWTVDDILALNTVSDPRITPDGTLVCYVVRSRNTLRNGYDSAIWIAPASHGPGSKLPESHFSDHHPLWSPDGSTLAFLSSRDGNSQIYTVNARGEGVKKITNVPTGVLEFRWLPSGRQFSYLATDALSADEERRLRQGDDPVIADHGYHYARLYFIPAGGGQSRLITKANRHVLSFDCAADETKVVFAAQDTPRGEDDFNVDLYEVDLQSGHEKAIVRQEGKDSDPAYSPDGRIIAFHSFGGHLNFFAQQNVAIVTSGGGTIRHDTKGLDVDVFRGGTEFWWSRDSSRIVFSGGRRTRDGIYRVGLATGKLECLVPAAGAPGANFSLSSDGRRMAFIRTSPDAPPDIYLADLGSGSIRTEAISRANPQIDQLPLVKCKVVHWKSTDGMEVEGVLRLPFNYTAGKPVPLLVELHGGPTGVELESYPIPRTYPTQLLLQKGFAVFAPNFRGSANYGESLRLANSKSQGFGDFDDVMTGVDMLIRQGIAEPARIGVMGWSYGGFLASWIIGHTNRFKAASIGGSGTDWVHTYATNQRPRAVIWTYFGGPPWDAFETYDRHSPRFSLSKIKTPSLLLRGQRDVDMLAEVYIALKDLKVPVEFVSYPREGHSISEPLHQRDLMLRNLEWFEARVLD